MKSGYRCFTAGIASLVFGLPALAQAPKTVSQPTEKPVVSGRLVSENLMPRATSERLDSRNVTRVALAQVPLPGDLGAPAQGSPGGPSLGTGAPGGFGSAQGSFAPPAPIIPGQPISVLVFPLSYSSPDVEAPAAEATTGGPRILSPEARLAAYATAALKAGLLSSPYFSVATYYPNSSLVQRAVKDEILRPEQAEGVVSHNGEVNPALARDVTFRISIQTLLIGSIEVKSEPAENRADVTLDAQLLNSATGDALRTAAVTGTAVGAADTPLEFVQHRAIQDAVHKMLPALGVILVSPEPVAKVEKEKDPPKKGRNSKHKKVVEQKQPKKSGRGGKGKPNAEDVPAESTSSKVPAPAEDRVALAEVPTVVGSGNVPGVANAAGQPIPYGYALSEAEPIMQERRGAALRIPPWLGVAAFCFGVAWLL